MIQYGEQRQLELPCCKCLFLSMCVARVTPKSCDASTRGVKGSETLVAVEVVHDRETYRIDSNCAVLVGVASFRVLNSYFTHPRSVIHSGSVPSTSDEMRYQSQSIASRYRLKAYASASSFPSYSLHVSSLTLRKESYTRLCLYRFGQ